MTTDDRFLHTRPVSNFPEGEQFFLEVDITHPHLSQICSSKFSLTKKVSSFKDSFKVSRHLNFIHLDVLKLCLELDLSQVHLSLIGTMREWGNNFPQLRDSSERWPFQDLMSTIWHSRLSTQLTSHYWNHEQDRNPDLILKSDDVWWENQSCAVNQGQAAIWRKAPQLR